MTVIRSTMLRILPQTIKTTAICPIRPFHRLFCPMSTGSKFIPKVAILYQAIDPPIVNGVRKPKKPGGYRDSSADIAYTLHHSGISITTPTTNPDPKSDLDWCFPDNESGILNAVENGATTLWANTILFADHPLQTSTALDRFASTVRVVGQPPRLVELYDDKNFVNDLLRRDGRFTLPESWLISSVHDLILHDIPLPIVAKPIRGRGSHGVKLCHTQAELLSHLKGLLAESSPAMLEQFLPGQEGTVTVMPPSPSNGDRYIPLPIVLRFNHADGIAPYNGVVAITQNSRLPTPEERKNTPAYTHIEQSCALVAERLRVTAPIRIDVRQVTDSLNSEFAIFDVNMKPNMTGPGRPGREDQASLTALAAEGVGWDYAELLKEILKGAVELDVSRGRSVE